MDRTVSVLPQPEMDAGSRHRARNLFHDYVRKKNRSTERSGGLLAVGRWAGAGSTVIQEPLAGRTEGGSRQIYKRFSQGGVDSEHYMNLHQGVHGSFGDSDRDTDAPVTKSVGLGC